MALRSNSWLSFTGVWSLAAIALGAFALAGMAHADGHSSLADFQVSARGNLFLQTFGGSIDTHYPAQTASGNGYVYTVNTLQLDPLYRSPHGIGPEIPSDTGLITFSGSPVSAFAATFFAEDNLAAAVAGSISVVTDTGETYTFSVPTTGAFFGVTSSRPFSTLRFSKASAGIWVKMDNAYVGISGSANTPTDLCTDAPMATDWTSHIPFSTAAATAEPISGTCTPYDNGPDVWVRYVPSRTGSVTITTCGCTFDSILRVFDSCGGSQIACNDDFCATSTGTNHASQVQFRIVAGQNYLVRISGFNGAAGDGVLSITATPDCGSDFNHSGRADVQDIFDFLAAWFGGCP